MQKKKIQVKKGKFLIYLLWQLYDYYQHKNENNSVWIPEIKKL